MSEPSTKKPKIIGDDRTNHTQKIYAKVDKGGYKYDDDDRSVESHENECYYELPTHKHFEDRESDEVKLWKQSKIAPESYWKEIKNSYHEDITMEYWLSLGRGEAYAKQSKLCFFGASRVFRYTLFVCLYIFYVICMYLCNVMYYTDVCKHICQKCLIKLSLLSS